CFAAVIENICFGPFGGCANPEAAHMVVPLGIGRVVIDLVSRLGCWQRFDDRLCQPLAPLRWQICPYRKRRLPLAFGPRPRKQIIDQLPFRGFPWHLALLLCPHYVRTDMA